jgi:hypothetical protein
MRAQGRALIEEKGVLNARLMRAEEAGISLRKALNDTSRTCRDQQEMLSVRKITVIRLKDNTDCNFHFPLMFCGLQILPLYSYGAIFF